jgi:hypothetical protein
VKKTLFVVALATMLLFALGTSAFAAENHSNQQRFGAAATASANVDVQATETVITGPNGSNWATGTVYPGYNSLYGAGTNIYEDWQPALLGNSSGNSPHGNYTTTTVKCVVCHAVHYAAPGGGPVGSAGATADTLLRMKASEACAYCHATSGQAVNGTPVYNGDGQHANGVDTAGNNNYGHYTGNDCNECHTSVHGGGADTSVASLRGYLLKTISLPAITGGGSSSSMLQAMTAIDNVAANQGYNAMNGYPNGALPASLGDYQNVNNDTLRQQAVGIFCAECHEGSYAAGAPGAATNVVGSNTVKYAGHRIAAAASSNWNSDGTKSSSTLGTTSNVTVAWAAADNCKSCHDSVDVFGNTAFPHAWGFATAPAQNGVANSAMWGTSAKMWLLSAQNAGAAKTEAGPAAASDTADYQLQDGVCLKCHVSTSGTAGVGITF